MASEELRSMIGRFFGAGRTQKCFFTPPDMRPGCAFGALIEQQLKDLEHEIGEIRSRLNTLIFLVIGAVVVEIVLRLVK